MQKLGVSIQKLKLIIDVTRLPRGMSPFLRHLDFGRSGPARQNVFDDEIDDGWQWTMSLQCPFLVNF